MRLRIEMQAPTRGAAVICGRTHRTVKRIIEAHEAASRGETPGQRVPGRRNYDKVAELVKRSVEKTVGKNSAQRPLPPATTGAAPRRLQ